MESRSVESLLRKMALIIDRQAIALGSIEFNKDSIDRAAVCHQELFEDIKVFNNIKSARAEGIIK